MKNKALHFMAAAVLSSALLMTGCGSHSGDTNSSTKQTQDQTQRGAGQDSAQTSAAEDQNQASDDQNQSQDTQLSPTDGDNYEVLLEEGENQITLYAEKNGSSEEITYTVTYVKQNSGDGDGEGNVKGKTRIRHLPRW